MNTKIINNIIIAAALLGLSIGTSNAHASDGHLVFNTAAIHFKNFSDRNAFVPGLGWEYSPSGKAGFHVGTLSDSFGAQAAYLGVNYGTRRFFNNKVRFLLGATIVHKQFHKNKPFYPLRLVGFTAASRFYIGYTVTLRSRQLVLQPARLMLSLRQAISKRLTVVQQPQKHPFRHCRIPTIRMARSDRRFRASVHCYQPQQPATHRRSCSQQPDAI